MWNGATEELVFVGGTLTDPEAVMGWHLLTEMTDAIGRVRVTRQESAVACTRSQVMVLELENEGVVVVQEEEVRRGITVGCFDANEEVALIAEGRGNGSVRRVVDLAEVCRLRVRGGAVGCVNGGYGVMVCGGGAIRVWEIEGGEYLYSFRERVGDCNAIVADERYVAAAAGGGIIHVWDFGNE